MSLFLERNGTPLPPALAIVYVSKPVDSDRSLARHRRLNKFGDEHPYELERLQSRIEFAGATVSEYAPPFDERFRFVRRLSHRRWRERPKKIANPMNRFGSFTVSVTGGLERCDLVSAVLFAIAALVIDSGQLYLPQFCLKRFDGVLPELGDITKPLVRVQTSTSS